MEAPARETRHATSAGGRLPALIATVLMALLAALASGCGQASRAAAPPAPAPTASASAAHAASTCAADQNVGDPQLPVEPGVHIPVGTQGHWLHDPPSSGQHWAQVPPWGVLEEARAAQGDVLVPEWYVSSLEHGGVAVLYRDAATKARVIAFIHAAPVEASVGAPKLGDVPYPTLKHPFALVAWGWLLYLDSLDDPQALKFYLAHLDHGPEGGCPNG